MAAKYRKVDPRFWTDENARTLSHVEKLLALYCFTSPQTNRCGIFLFSTALAGEELDLKPSLFLSTFKAVRERLSWPYDKVARVLYLPTWWKYNPPENQKHLIGCLGDLHDLPQTTLLQRFMANTRYLSDTQREWYRIAIPIAIPIAIGVGIAYQEQEQEQEQEQKQDKTGSVPKRPTWSNEQVDAIYQAYPKHVEPTAAKSAIRRALDRLAKDKPPLDNPALWLLTRTEEYAREKQGTEPKFIRSPQRWFNNGGHLGEPQKGVTTDDIANRQRRTAGARPAPARIR